KGDVLAVARVAGIMAAKRTPDIVPLCHPLPLTRVDVTPVVVEDGVTITAAAETTAQTGVEMEALTAVLAAALTVYDMTNGLDLAELVRTTGGTGFAPRDVTPEATAAVVERPTPGLDEAMREVSRRASPHGLLSRGSSGIRGAALIVNFPGSPRACAECFDAIAPALGHGVELITSPPTEHP